jgi:hypothetical protein
LVSEKFTIGSPATEAVTVYGPPAVPFAVKGAEATPKALVATVIVVVELLNIPLAPVAGAANVTLTPEIGELATSVTVTAGGFANAVLIDALCGVVPALAVMMLGVPGSSITHSVRPPL